ncbi:MAG: YggT family protein [Chloroflexi bacterium]|nr:YggT family protein [Chloroflexota bacterium]MYI83392.1 YggT family protein [Chloroflexota bacterium]
MIALVNILYTLLTVLWIAIFARAIVSWFPISQDGPIVRALDAITEPVLEPLRRVVPRVGLFDITPMVAILLIIVIQGLLSSSVR